MGIKVAGAVALNGVILAVEARQAVEVPLTETALARDAEILFAGRVTAVRAGEKGAGGRLILSLGLDTAPQYPWVQSVPSGPGLSGQHGRVMASHGAPYLAQPP